MQVLPISKVKDRLNELVEDAVATHDQVIITKNGSPAAVLVSADEWEALQETLFWLAQPGLADDIARGRAEYEQRATKSEDEVRTRYGVPERS